MKEKKIFLVALAVIMLVILGANTVFATGVVINLPTSNNAVTSNNTVEANNVVSNNTANNAVNIASGTNNVANNTTNISTISSYNNTNKNNTTNLPKTGANDYIVIALIAVVGVSAIYAYKKVREYNV